MICNCFGCEQFGLCIMFVHDWYFETMDISICAFPINLSTCLVGPTPHWNPHPPCTHVSFNLSHSLPTLKMMLLFCFFNRKRRTWFILYIRLILSCKTWYHFSYKCLQLKYDYLFCACVFVVVVLLLQLSTFFCCLFVCFALFVSNELRSGRSPYLFPMK